jgi:hypothetical protein
MKIHIEINNLVLQGFNYRDHKQIGYAIETELARLIREENHLSQNFEIKEIPYMSSVFEISVNKDPKRIGADVAKSLFNELNKNF